MFNRFFLFYFFSSLLFSIQIVDAQNQNLVKPEICFNDESVDATKANKTDAKQDATKANVKTQDIPKILACLENLKKQEKFQEIIDLEEKIKVLTTQKEQFSYLILFSKISLNLKKLEDSSSSIDLQSLALKKDQKEEIKIIEEIDQTKKDELTKLKQKYELQYDLNQFLYYQKFIEDQNTKECEITKSKTVGYCRCESDSCQLLLKSHDDKIEIKDQSKNTIKFFTETENELQEKMKKIYISLASFLFSLIISIVITMIRVIKMKRNNLTNNG